MQGTWARASIKVFCSQWLSKADGNGVNLFPATSITSQKYPANILPQAEVVLVYGDSSQASETMFDKQITGRLKALAISESLLTGVGQCTKTFHSVIQDHTGGKEAKLMKFLLLMLPTKYVMNYFIQKHKTFLKENDTEIIHYKRNCKIWTNLTWDGLWIYLSNKCSNFKLWMIHSEWLCKESFSIVRNI